MASAFKYESVLQERDKELSRPYPNHEFIERCNKILARLQPIYFKVRGQ